VNNLVGFKPTVGLTSHSLVISAAQYEDTVGKKDVCLFPHQLQAIHWEDFTVFGRHVFRRSVLFAKLAATSLDESLA
jgi:hypothetical protein